MTFAPQYVRCVLNENFEDAKRLFLTPLLSVHYAHLVMLRSGDCLGRRCARPARGARRDPAKRGGPGRLRRGLRGPLLLRGAAAGRAVRGGGGRAAAHGAQPQRHRHDDVPDGAAPARAVAARRHARPPRALIGVAARHLDTLIPLHTHTQPAQPSTVAHYLLAVIEQLERDAPRLRPPTRPRTAARSAPARSPGPGSRSTVT